MEELYKKCCSKSNALIKEINKLEGLIIGDVNKLTGFIHNERQKLHLRIPVSFKASIDPSPFLTHNADIIKKQLELRDIYVCLYVCSGCSMAEITEAFHLSKSRIYQILKAEGIILKDLKPFPIGS